MIKDYFSIQEAADYLNFHYNTIYKAVDSGNLKAYRPGNGKLWRIKKEDLEEWIIRENQKIRSK